MPRKKRRKNYRGHRCWCCGRIRPNEKFSGKGHARHLCKECQQLGGEELAYRQALIDMYECVDEEFGTIRRKRRAQFNLFLEHDNARVRKEAEEILAEDAQIRAELEEIRRQAEEYETQLWAEIPDEAPKSSAVEERERDPTLGDEIPF